MHVGKGRKDEGANIKGVGRGKMVRKWNRSGATRVGPTFNTGEFSVSM